MKDIKFKGISDDSNKWIYGKDLKQGNYTYINGISIKKDSLCMYTGSKDVNGIDLYCGDVVECDNLGQKIEATIYWSEKAKAFVLSTPSYHKKFTRFHGRGKMRFIRNDKDILLFCHDKECDHEWRGDKYDSIGICIQMYCENCGKIKEL